MDEKKAPRKRLTKAELTEVLLKKVNDWIEGGDSPEDAVGRLTDKQYDFLIDQGVDFDSLLLTPEQLKNAQSIMGKQAGRRKGMKYNKKYPEEQARPVQRHSRIPARTGRRDYASRTPEFP